MVTPSKLYLEGAMTFPKVVKPIKSAGRLPEIGDQNL
jgi:hypothetical protein